MTAVSPLPRPTTARPALAATHIRVNNTTDSLQTLTAADGDVVSVMPGITLVEARFAHSYDTMALRLVPVRQDEIPSQTRDRPVTVTTLSRAY